MLGIFPIVLQLLTVLSLTAYWVLLDFCQEVNLNCSIDIGVIFKPCNCVALVLCIRLWYRLSWANFLSCNFDCYWLAVTLWTSCVRVFWWWSVSTLGLAPLYPFELWDVWLWLVAQVGDSVVTLCNWRLWTTLCTRPVLFKKWINLSCMLHQY